jgi:hypothetical protein
VKTLDPYWFNFPDSFILSSTAICLHNLILVKFGESNGFITPRPKFSPTPLMGEYYGCHGSETINIPVGNFRIIHDLKER